MIYLDTVYALHSFSAENEDELTFEAGEPITIIQRDDGFNDGWYKGKNRRGDIGLFPKNYISSQPPTPSSLNGTIKQRHNTDIINGETPSLHSSNSSSYSADPPIFSYRSNKLASSIHSATASSSILTHSGSLAISDHLKKSVLSTLNHPALKNTSAENWDVDQVEIWLHAMEFSSVASTFKEQEITGDILLELNMEALKELNVPTFGRRFKIQTAITALREERYQPKKNNGRVSFISNTSEDTRCLPTSQSGTSGHPVNKHFHSAIHTSNRHSMGYHSISNDKTSQFRTSDYLQIGEESDINRLPRASSDVPIATSHELVQESHDRSYTLSNQMYNLQQISQVILPMVRKNTVDAYSLSCNDDKNNTLPDFEGWLHKQSSRYKTWNKRWFVLKGSNLFYFKSPKDARMKGIINLRGYRVTLDDTIQAGKYCFRVQHSTERTFQLYTDDEASAKSWIIKLMKATISRDYSSPVMSSSAIHTISLEAARRLKPRPPSVLLQRKEKDFYTPSNDPPNPSSKRFD
ncbi:hypothetical protein BDB01DRAFT_847302 [Pilobolus umbonatus]|nr:hypothetical protein BDB01DRAFT_847302 [Pilobolus umbonatus]